MFTPKRLSFILIMLAGFTLILAACQSVASANTTSDSGSGMGMGMGMGQDMDMQGMGMQSMGDNGMMIRHSATIPEEFAGLNNPITADEDSLARGEVIYTTNCIVCHGESGMGEGLSAVNLNPQPAPIAHTSQMMSDAYLFWRITEGGVPFETAMIPYGGILDEQARWDVINYVRSLGNVDRMGGMGIGHMPSDATMRAEMLTQAVEQKIITQEEAEIFELVHSAVTSIHAGDMMNGMGGGMGHQMGGGMGMAANMNMTEILASLVESGTLTQEQVDAFLDIHTRLEEAGLMK